MNQDKIWAHFQSGEGESFAGANPRLRYLVQTADKLIANQRQVAVLNIGIGNAFLERECLKHNWKTSSLDPDKVAVDKLKASNVDAHAGYIENMPFANETFDAVFSSEVFEHLSKQQLDAGLHNIHRVLKNGKYLVGTVPYKENLKSGETVCPHCGETFHRWGHQLAFDKESMSQIMTSHGFEVVRMGSYTFPDFSIRRPYHLMRSSILWMLGCYGSQLVGPNLLFVVKKV